MGTQVVARGSLMSATGVGNGRIRRARSRVLSRAGASRRLHEEGRASSGRAPQGQRASGGARSSVCLTDQMNWSQKHVSCNVPHGGIWGERPRFPRFEYGATTEVGTRSEFTYDRWWVLVGLQQAVGPAWNLRRLVCDWATFWSRALLFAGRLYKVHAIQTRFLYFTYKSSSYLTVFLPYFPLLVPSEFLVFLVGVEVYIPIYYGELCAYL